MGRSSRTEKFNENANSEEVGSSPLNSSQPPATRPQVQSCHGYAGLWNMRQVKCVASQE